MAKRTEFAGLSQRARNLLGRKEGVDVEYKSNVKGLDSGDLLAFANSDTGGAILVGVAETAEGKGRPMGCEIGDGPRLQILNKALDCIPPVEIELVVENLNDKPFYRIEIPPSSLRPHCTGRGTYKIREDGRTTALSPELLLQVFLRKEASEFRERFQAATAGLTGSLNSTLRMVVKLEESLKKGLKNIEGSLGSAEWAAENAESTIDTVDTRVGHLETLAKESAMRVQALLAAGGVEDPVKAAARRRLKEQLLKQLKEKPELLQVIAQKRSLNITSPELRHFDKEEAGEILTEAALEAAGVKDDDSASMDRFDE